MKKKTYIGFIRDHSGSMNSLRRGAMEDYNRSLTSIQEAARGQNLDNIISVIRCGIGPDTMTVRSAHKYSYISWENRFSAAQSVEPIREYPAVGNTPLFDAVGEMINLLEKAPDANDPDVAFLLIATTDGEENGSWVWNARSLSDKMRTLQATDRWTFTFRVPRGYRRTLTKLGIPDGNILEWDQTEDGINNASLETKASFDSYFSARSIGQLSTRGFYTNMSSVKPAEVKAVLTEMPKAAYQIYDVDKDIDITSFFTAKHGSFTKGTALYQLTKAEKAVQDYKKIAIQDRASGKVYSGDAARQLLGLPTWGTHKVVPGDHGQWAIFIQSTSTNRVLKAGTKVMWMP